MNDNELIAEFMGFRYGQNADKNGFMKYNKSWDWLMPVVEKIESLPEHPLYKKYRFSVSIKNNSCEISFARLSKGEPGHNHYEGKTKIDAVYKSVIDFIKWYNQQKP